MTRTTQIPITVTLPEGAPQCCCGSAAVGCPSNTEHPESFTITGFVDQLNINGVIVYGWSLLNGTHPWVVVNQWETVFEIYDTLAPGAKYYLQAHLSFTCDIIDGERVFKMQVGYGARDMGACMSQLQELNTDEEYPTGPFVLTNPSCPYGSPVTVTLNWGA